MKRNVGIAFGIAFSATLAFAGSIGGLATGNGMYYDASTRTLVIPGKVAEQLFIMRAGSPYYQGYTSYELSADEFTRLQRAADTNLTVSGTNKDRQVRYYKVESGDQIDEVKLIDLRIKMRSEVNY